MHERVSISRPNRWLMILAITLSVFGLCFLGTPFNLFTNTQNYTANQEILEPTISLPYITISKALGVSSCEEDKILDAEENPRVAKEIFKGLEIFQKRLAKNYKNDSFAGLVAKTFEDNLDSAGSKSCLPPLLLGGVESDVQEGVQILLDDQILSCGINPAIGSNYSVSASINNYIEYLKKNNVVNETTKKIRKLEVRQKELRFSNKSGLREVNRRLLKAKLAKEYALFYIKSGELLTTLYDSLCLAVSQDFNVSTPPLGPTNLGFTSASRKLNWNSSGENFLVYLSQDQGNSYFLVGETSEPSFILNSLVANNSYQAKVFSVSQVSVGDRSIRFLSSASKVLKFSLMPSSQTNPSPTIPQTPTTPIPSPIDGGPIKIPAPKILSPLGATVELGAENQVFVTWENVSGATGYLVRYQNITDNTAIVQDNNFPRALGENTTYQFTGAVNKTYLFWVHSKSASFKLSDDQSYSDKREITFTVVAKSASSCSGATEQACVLANGEGVQSRTCNSGSFGNWGTCNLLSCNSGYKVSGNTCVLNVPTIITPYKSGDKVQLTKDTNVREAGSITGILLGKQLAGAIGTLVGEPTSADNIIWWRVDFDSGIDGITGQDNYQLYQAPTTCTNGQTAQRTMYQESSVVYGKTCLSELQTGICTNGIFGNWTGTYTKTSCVVGSAPEGNSCANGASNSITRDGITWKFTTTPACGKFVNGDYWVLGPVTISEITPKPVSGLNGTMVNPANQAKHGFDSRANGYDSSYASTLPLKLTTPSSVISTISRTDCIAGKTCRPSLQTASILTVLLEKPADNGSTVFRPPYAGTVKTLFSTKTMKTNLLPSLEAPQGVDVSLEAVRKNFENPWIDFIGDWNGRFTHPVDSMPDYGADISIQTNEGALRLMFNDSITDKMPALLNYLQLGIDLYGNLGIGTFYGSNGGHMHGRILPLAFTATVLDSSLIKQAILSRGLSNFQEDGSVVVSKIDGKILFGQPQTGGELDYWKNQMVDSGSRTIPDPYGYIDGGLQPGGWYQFCCTSSTYKGTALALHLMPKLKEVWPAVNFTKYVDRWVTEGAVAAPDSCAGATVYNKTLVSTSPVHVKLWNDLKNLNLDESKWKNKVWEQRANFGYGTLFGPDGKGDCIKGSGRHLGSHGKAKDSGGYISNFTNSLWRKYR